MSDQTTNSMFLLEYLDSTRLTDFYFQLPQRFSCLKYIIQSAERPQQPGVPLALQQTSSAGALAIFIGVTRVIFIVDVLVLQANSPGMLNRVIRVTIVVSYIFSRSATT
jgi:hypothetical protein